MFGEGDGEESIEIIVLVEVYSDLFFNSGLDLFSVNSIDYGNIIWIFCMVG